MKNPDIKFVPSTVVCGERGHVVTRAYTEIGGLRIYADQVVVGDRGQHVISKGWVEASPEQKKDAWARSQYSNDEIYW